MALKLGVVEGQENPLATIYGNNLHEVQQYIMETQHLIGFYIVSTGPHYKTRFDENERTCLTGSLQEATDWHNQELNRSETQYRDLLEKAGVEFIKVDRKAFQKVAQVEIPLLFERKWKKDLYRQISEMP
jgi:TRAP-type C4-dicarboxylate transport system substrate-binding protein